MEETKRYWERRHGFTSEFQIDARWILHEENDPHDPPKAWGSLRIVSFPNLRPGYLKAIATFVTARRPKTQKEIEQTIEDYQMEETELEVYSIDEHVTTQIMEHEAPKRDLEELFNVKIFQ